MLLTKSKVCLNIHVLSMLNIVYLLDCAVLVIIFVHTHIHLQDSLAPNVIAMIQSFNQLALLVPSEILGETTAQARAKVITSYIQVRNIKSYLQVAKKLILCVFFCFA